MKEVQHILVVVDRAEGAGNVMDKAARLASANQASVHVMSVIHENLVEYGKMSAEDAQALKLFIMRAEEEALEDLLDDWRARFEDLTSATIWNKRVSVAVVDVVADLGIDLVIKSTDDQGMRFPRHPDDWNLVREAPCPVLLVGTHAWAAKPSVSAAVDALDAEHADINRRIIEAADAVTASLDGELTVVSAFPRLEPWSSDPTIGVDFVRLKQELEQEVRARVAELTEGLDSDVRSVCVGEGSPAQIIKRLTDEAEADVIVVGTAARKGVSAWVIGNTSEALLDLVDRDLLILHV